MNLKQLPEINTLEDLTNFIRAVTERPHDYDSCADAMAITAAATFNFVGKTLQVTHYQARFADRQFLSHTRDLQYGVVLNFNDLLYPQYDLHKRLDEAMNSPNVRVWLRGKAEELLKTYPDASPRVLKHWEKIIKTK